MKKLIILILLLIIGTVFVYAVEKNSEVLNFITKIYSPRNFKNGAISEEVIQQILVAGHKAPSARNQQPWHFTVVQNKKVIDQIMNNVNDGNVLIVVSGSTSPTAFNNDFDLALATQNMFIASQTLGLAARIYAMPVGNINDKLLKTLDIPENFKAYIVLRIGYEADGMDAITSASPRAGLETKVNFIK